MSAEGAVDLADVVCPFCPSEEPMVKVWEDKSAFENGEAPDYAGCMTCHTMHSFTEVRYGGSE